MSCYSNNPVMASVYECDHLGGSVSAPSQTSPGPRKWHQCPGLRQSADSVAIFGKNWKVFGFSCYCRVWACGRPAVTVQLKWTHKTLEAAMRPSHWPVTLRPRPLIGQWHLITRLYLSSLLSSLPLLRYSDLSRRLIFEKTVIICKSSPIRSIGQNSFFILWRCVRLVRWRINLVYTSISKCSD